MNSTVHGANIRPGYVSFGRLLSMNRILFLENFPSFGGKLSVINWSIGQLMRSEVSFGINQ